MAAAVAAGLLLFPPAARTANCSPDPDVVDSVDAGIVHAAGCFFHEQGSPQFTSVSSTVDLNGFTVNTSTTPLRINTETRRVVTSSTRPAEIKAEPLPYARLTAPAGGATGIDFTAPPNVDGKSVQLGEISIAGGLPQLAGFPLASAQVPIYIDSGGTGRIEVRVSTGPVFKLQNKDYSASVTLDVRPPGNQFGGGIFFKGIAFDFDPVPTGLKLIGLMPIRGVAASYTAPAPNLPWYKGSFSGKISAALPDPSKQPDDQIRIELALAAEDGSFKSFAFAVKNIDKEIMTGTGVFLQDIGGGVTLRPFGLDAAARLTAGPEYTFFGKKQSVVSVGPMVRNGEEIPNFRFRLNSDNAPGFFSVGGGVKFLTVQTHSAELTIYFNGVVSFRSDIGFGLPSLTQDPSQPFYLGGGISGWFDVLSFYNVITRQPASQARFNFEGYMLLRLFNHDIARGRAVFSYKGIAACAGVDVAWWTVELGAAYGLPSGPLRIFAPNQCGIGDYRVAARAGAALAASGSTTLHLGPRQRILKIVGEDATPAFTLRSDDGETINYDPARRQFVEGPHNSYRIYGSDSDTYGSKPNFAVVLLGRPRGKWRLIDPSDGNRIVAVKRAKTVPSPKLRASVSGEGLRRSMHWNLSRVRDGERIVFTEQMRKPKRRGQKKRPRPVRQLFATKRASGSRAFTATPDFIGKHVIRATVLRNGSPVLSRRVDSFRVDFPRPPAKPASVRARAFGSTVKVHWSKVRRAKGYVAVLSTLKGGVSVPQEVGRRQLRTGFHNMPLQKRMRVKVFALGRLGVPSDPAVAVFNTGSKVRNRGEAAAALAGSAKVLDEGDLLFVAPCPNDGHCVARVVVSAGGDQLGSAQRQVVPHSARQMVLQLPGAFERRLVRGGRLRAKIRASITQAGHEATRVRGAVLRRG